MIGKKRPKFSFSIKHDIGNKGYENFGRDYFVYYCATCGKQMNFYRQEDVCEKCGTFHDWWDSEPRIVMVHEIDWKIRE